MTAPALVPIVTESTTGRVLYALQPKQLIAFRQTPLWRGAHKPGPHHIGYGGAAGGGKSYLSRGIAVAAAFLWPGSTSIIFRETEWSVNANHVTKFWQEVPAELEGQRLYRWNGDQMCATWENGSRTYFGYLKEEKDVLRYQGPEYDIMIFEEATHYSESQVQWLTGNRLRATVEGADPFVVYPSNPGNRGHQWYMRLFVKRDFRPEEDPEDYVFIKARLADNLILSARDPAYRRRLDRLPEPHRSWLRDGDFESGAGSAFSELAERVHFTAPFEVPPHWPRWGSFDWGYRHPAVFGLFTRNEDGQIFLLDSVKMYKHQSHEMVDRVRHLVGDFRRLQYTVAGRDVWSDRKAWDQEAPILAEYFAAQGWKVRQAVWDRVQGYRKVRDALAWRTRGREVDGEPTEGRPDFTLIRTAANRDAYDGLAAMVPDATGEDVMKVDANDFGDGGDDHYDMIRYGLMSPALPVDGEALTTSAWSPETLAAESEAQRRFRGLPIAQTRHPLTEYGRWG